LYWTANQTKEETVKKQWQWIVLALVAVIGLVADSFADVQNIRLSGDIRTRGYYLGHAAESDTSGNLQADSSFIEQRTRVSVEADLEDHVLVVVTLKAEGLWGAPDQSSTAGPGTEDDAGGAINRGWSTGIDEAYVQLNEMFYSPLTLKLGRQYLNYGHGLILSSVEQEYNYDSSRLVLDYYPLTLDLVYARVVDNGSFGGDSNHQSADLLFLNARYEMSDSVVKDIEAYFGWVAQSAHNGASSTAAPPTMNGASPWVIGVRGDLTPADSLKVWFEGTYEGGADGTVNNEGISAFLANAGASFAFKGGWSPVVKANYTFASGGGKGQAGGPYGTPGQSTFRPWFDYVEGYNGYLFAPELSNIHIFNLGVTSKPYENLSLSLNVYYYLKADTDSFAGSNPNIDFGGLEYTREGVQSNSRQLGWEIDNVLGYDYSKDVRFQLVNATFIPAGAYRHDGNQPSHGGTAGSVNSVSREVRAEVSVKF
jgi:hypothetical protein